DISINFIIYLLESGGYDIVLIIINYLIKIKYLISCSTMANTTAIILIYIQYI
ncbi:uncharacterized protein BO87DRAFT_317007, partial [Aspergillus neoniger CBS 115656]